MSDNNRNTSQHSFSSLSGFHRAVPIILAAVAAFLAVCLMTDGAGGLGSGVSMVLKGLFSAGAYVIPVGMIFHAVFYASDLANKKIKSRLIFTTLFVISVSCIDYAIYYWGADAVFAPGAHFAAANAGGFIGGILGFLLMSIFGHIGVLILAIAALGIYATFFFAEHAGSLGKAALAFKEGFHSFASKLKEKKQESDDKKKQLQAEIEQQQREAASQELIDDEFFKPKGGASDVKINQLGIDESASPSGASTLLEKHFEEEPEVVVEQPQPEKRRRRSDKPLDLSYGIEEEIKEEAEPTPEDKPEEEVKEEKAMPSNSFFGLDDSADNVFTKDFDPFNFATSEKVASKQSSRVAIQEDLDDMALYEMRANHEPTDREKRMMELEKRKKEWMNSRPARPQARPVEAATPVEPAPQPAEPFLAQPETVAEPQNTTPAFTPSHTPAPSFGAADTEKVNAYTSYSTTKTTYTQPIKSVEFTITKGAPKTPVAPTESEAYSVTFDKNSELDSTEDVAAIIAERIARNNPAYARSANEMRTFTTVISSDIDPVHAEEEVASEVETEPTVAETDRDVPIEELTVGGEESYNEETTDSAAIPVEEINFPEETSEPVAEVSEEPIAEATEDPIAEATEEPAAPEVIDLTPEVEGEAIAENPSPYAHAAEFASALMGESARSAERGFRPYIAPVGEISFPEATPVESETLKVEREMLSPTPAPIPTVVQTVEDTPALELEATESSPETIPTETSEAQSEAAPATAEEEVVWNDTEDDEPDVNTASEEDLDFSYDEDEEDEDDGDDDDGEGEPELYEEEDSDMEEIPPEEQNPEVIKMREMFPFLAPIGQQAAAQAEAVTEEEDEEEETNAADAEEDEDEVPFDEPVKKVAAKTESKSLVPSKEKKGPDYSNFEFPSIDLLAKEESAYDENIQAEIQENADKLIETLASFNVTASIKGVDRGPRITRYEVVPAKGVKVSSILNLQDDIALNLAAGSLRMEAPIPGKSAVGIEIPNKKSTTVRLRNLLETEDFKSAKSKTAVCIGRDVAGQPVFGDIAKMPHLLIAGATGMGKSVCINSLLISILYKARPDEVKLIMIDPKQVEFTMYNGIPHLLVPVVSDPKQAAGALMWAVEEMERRYNLFYPTCVRNIDAYNEKVAQDRSIGEPMSKIIIVIDEFADLMLQVKDPVETLVMRIAQKARAAGIYLIIGTQRPSVNVITGVIKANIPSRISCKVMSNVDSKTVLDSAGAEKLLDRGDALYAPSGSPKPHRVQCAFVADSEVESIMNHLRQFSDGSNYDSKVMEEIERAAQKCNKKGGSSADRDDDDGESGGEGYLNDRQFLDAVEVAVNTRKISTSLIQRKLSIGYGKAAKFIDIMEDMGIVGEANGQRPREVLLTPDEWREKLARATLD